KRMAYGFFASISFSTSATFTSVRPSDRVPPTRYFPSGVGVCGHQRGGVAARHRLPGRPCLPASQPLADFVPLVRDGPRPVPQFRSPAMSRTFRLALFAALLLTLPATSRSPLAGAAEPPKQKFCPIMTTDEIDPENAFEVDY